MPTCARCNKDVFSAEEKKAAGRVYHEGCFTCKTCNTKLETNISEHEREIYCKQCYGKNFGPKGFVGGVGGMEGTADVAGLDAEMKAKKEAKYTSEKEKVALDFIRESIGVEISAGKDNVQAALVDGVHLCNLLLKYRPGCITAGKVKSHKVAALQREVVDAFLKGCRNVGMRDSDLFTVVDLQDGSNMPLVIDTVIALKTKFAPSS